MMIFDQNLCYLCLLFMLLYCVYVHIFEPFKSMDPKRAVTQKFLFYSVLILFILILILL